MSAKCTQDSSALLLLSCLNMLTVSIAVGYSVGTDNVTKGMRMIVFVVKRVLPRVVLVAAYLNKANAESHLMLIDSDDYTIQEMETIDDYSEWRRDNFDDKATTRAIVEGGV